MTWFCRDIWENVSDLKGEYNWFVFKFFDFSPFKVSCLNTYKVSVAREILHIAFFSSSTLLSFVYLAVKLLSYKMALC